MSIIVASGEQISKSPINTSTSKQMYSFPKALRFQQSKNISSSNTFYYNLPPVKSMRSTSLGKGGKYDFTSGNKGKNTQFYNMHSDFDPKNPHTPAWTFGISRDHYEKVYYETNKMLDKNVPGPGKYNYLKPFGSEATKFSMYGKGEGKNLNQTSRVPGPGQYPIVSINPGGKYPLSNMKNATTIVFGQSKEKRFNYSFNTNPGPDKYPQTALITGTGYNFVSKFKSSTAKTMVGKKKDFVSKFPIPGPGTYRAFSEFGIYESRKANNRTFNNISLKHSRENTQENK